MLRQGFAKSLFYEREQKSPWLYKSKKESPWPFLNELLNQGTITYLDLSLAHQLLKQEKQASQHLAVFICHLFLAAKKGHLCVKIGSDSMQPDIASIWESEENCLSDQTKSAINQFIIDGSRNIPPTLCSLDTPSNKPLCVHRDLFYLQRHWILESQLLENLKAHLAMPSELCFDKKNIQAAVSAMTQKGELLAEQAEAIMKCMGSSLTLITGGPGTGKTYTAGQLIKVLWNGLTPEQRTNCQIVLAAPTGKAAANLQKSLGQAVALLEDLPKLQAKTLHLLLGIKSADSTLKSFLIPLSADIVVIDESSMIDVKMMGYLLQALKPGSRLILLGDQYQLPSVEAGSIFYDLIQLAKTNKLISYAELKTCLRTDLQSILKLARHVNQGDVNDALTCLDLPGIKKFELDNNSQKSFVDNMKDAFPSFKQQELDPSEILNSFNQIRILSPLRKGNFGIEILNHQILQQIVKHAPTSGWMAIPIMVVTNDYKMDLFNGETGVLMRKLPLKGPCLEDYALFPARNPSEQPRRLSSLILPKFEHAYCLSVHKSQGSEFDKVVLVMTEGSEVLGREMLYTAITRARHSIDIHANDQVLIKTIQQQGRRHSGIQARIGDIQ